jgi:hypothetical protein
MTSPQRNGVYGLLFLCCTATLAFKACGATPDSVAEPMFGFYKANHWIPLPLPDSRFAPGTIFSFTPQTGIRYVSDLATCGVPNDIVSAVPGTSGKLIFNKEAEYGADAVLKMKGVTAGPEFSKVKKTTLEQDDHGPSSLNLIKVQIWMTDPKNTSTFPEVCTSYLSRPDIFVVQEAYRISRGKYTLVDNTNAKIAVKGLRAGPVSIEPSAQVKISNDGALEFTDTLYTAIRRVKRVSGDWQTLANPNQGQDADEEILKALPATSPPS